MADEGAVNDAAFFAITLDSYFKCDVTPDIGTEIGVRIAAPATVVAGARSVSIPVCAIAQFDYATRASWSPDLWGGFVAVAIDATGRFAAARPLADPTASPEPIPDDERLPPGPPESRPPDARFAQYFNFDLARFLPIGPQPAEHFIFLTQGRFHSNTVRVRVLPLPRDTR